MEIAIASGKGGTGKTTVAVNLALVSDQPVTLADCDVEEPNVNLFLNAELDSRRTFSVLNPHFDETACDGCGICRQHCRFNAIAVLARKPIVFPELCHACGACMAACPRNAIQEAPRPIGEVEEGSVGSIRLVQGRLDIGEAKSPPLIEEVRQTARPGKLTIIDAPPGTSCPVVSAVRDTDYLVLVTEPTPFGLHDLQLAFEMAKALSLRHGVLVNRAGIGDATVYGFCRDQGIPIIGEIPYDKDLALAYSEGKAATAALPRYHDRFSQILRRIREEAGR